MKQTTNENSHSQQLVKQMKGAKITRIDAFGQKYHYSDAEYSEYFGAFSSAMLLEDCDRLRVWMLPCTKLSTEPIIVRDFPLHHCVITYEQQK